MQRTISSAEAHYLAVLAGVLSLEVQFAVILGAAYWLLAVFVGAFEASIGHFGWLPLPVIAIAMGFYVLMALAAFAIGRKDGAQFYYWHIAVGMDQRRPFLDTFWATMNCGVLVKGGRLESKNRTGLLAIGNGLMAIVTIGSHFTWLFIIGYVIFLTWYLMNFVSRRWEMKLASRQA